MCAAMIVVGCSSTPSTEEDSGTDASATDSGKNDAGMDAAKDTGTDTGKDTSTNDVVTDSHEEDVIDGGDVDADDGGPPPPPDASIDASDGGSSICKVNFGFGSISMQGCSSGENWTCGNDTYEFECYCPGQACECRKNNQAVGKVQAANGCPNCQGFTPSSIANLCGFPY
jgi:hypothetical protein